MMVFLIIIFYLIIASTAFHSNLTAELSAPPAALPAIDASAVPATPAAAPLTTPDAAALAPATPAPEGAQPQAVVAEAPPLQAEQLKWPDTIELAEDTKGLVQTSNKKVIDMYKTAEKSITECFKKNDTIMKQCKDLAEKFGALDDTLDPFMQGTRASVGKLEEVFKPSTKSNKPLN